MVQDQIEVPEGSSFSIRGYPQQPNMPEPSPRLVGKTKHRYHYVWYCCQIDSYGPLLMDTMLLCPDPSCGHARCSNCRVEKIKNKD